MYLGKTGSEQMNQLRTGLNGKLLTVKLSGYIIRKLVLFNLRFYTPAIRLTEMRWYFNELNAYRRKRIVHWI